MLRQPLISRLAQVPVVALLGSRQVGKTTLARTLDPGKPVHYLDLERPSDLAKLNDPELYLAGFEDCLVVLDEIQLVPELFPVLRSLVDERRFKGEKAGHFLLLGSASPELLRESSETLAGRIAYFELTPLRWSEILPEGLSMHRHWFRGGYPDSLLAPDDAASCGWRRDFITSHLERHLPQTGITVGPVVLRRFCTMLAHTQGGMVNATSMGNALGLDGKTVRRYLELLEHLFLVRQLPPWSRNVGKRLVKSGKTYWRDSGLLHELLGLSHLEAVLGHPVCGPSWEGYAIEQILSALPPTVSASHYRTHAGAEVDLVLEYADGRTHAIEIKRTLAPKATSAFRESMKTLEAERGFILTPAGDRYPLAENIEAVPLADFLASLL